MQDQPNFLRRAVVNCGIGSAFEPTLDGRVPVPIKIRWQGGKNHHDSKPLDDVLEFNLKFRIDLMRDFLEDGRNAAELAAQVSQHRDESIARGLGAYIQIDLEEYEDARDQINRGLEATRNAETKRFEPPHLQGLARIVHGKGDRAEAWRLGEEA